MTRNPHWLAWLSLAAIVTLPLAASATTRTLGLEVWTDRGDDAVYQPGDAMTVKVRANDDGYLLVYEIDSEGRISVLYPWRRGAGLIEGKRTYRLPPEDSNYELSVEKETGQGFIVALLSREPFRDLPWYLRPYDPQAASVGYERGQEDEEGFDSDGHVVGDPYVAMERIRRRVLDQPGDTDGFATSYASYYVAHEVRYPRYICNDCHRPGQYAFWDGFDPYYAQCSVVDFRVNWDWCWGPRMWTAAVPYYYYVVRENCPPRYRAWYDNHSRWSSWDGRQKWNALWGGSLTRYKSPGPPTSYVPPGPHGTFNPGAPPPGYLVNVEKRGLRVPTPIGRDGQPRGDNGGGSGTVTRGAWRGAGGGGDKPPGVGRMPAGRTPGNEGGGTSAPAWRGRGAQRQGPPRGETPRGAYRPRNEPRPAVREGRSESPRFQPPPARPAAPPRAESHHENGGGHH